MNYVFQNHCEMFFDPVVPSLTVECRVFEIGEKILLLSLLANGRERVQCLPWDVFRFDRFWCLHQAERQDISSLSNTKSRHVSTLSVCSRWSCISSVVKLSVYFMSALLYEALRHLDFCFVLRSIYCLKFLSFFFFNHPFCLTHFLDPEFCCCCCRMISFSMCQLRL